MNGFAVGGLEILFFMLISGSLKFFFNSLRSISIDETFTRIKSTLEHSKKFNSSLFKKKLSSNISNFLHQK